MTSAISIAEQNKLEAIFLDGAMRVPEDDEHWIHDSDEAESYCYDCAAKRVSELLAEDPGGEYCVDGGWGTEGDSTPFCVICFKRLSNTLTDYGCEAEVEHFLMYGFSPINDFECLDMYNVIQSRGWEAWTGLDAKTLKVEREYFADLYRLCRIILDQHFWIMPNNDYRHMWE